MSQRPRFDWAQLLITSGLGALIAAAGGGAIELMKGRHDESTQRCAIAVQLLQDETLNPNLDEAHRRRDVLAASDRFERCMKE